MHLYFKERFPYSNNYRNVIIGELLNYGFIFYIKDFRFVTN